MTRLNRWLAVKITNGVGTMWCAYAFAALALLSLPNAIHAGDVVDWFAQSFLQLVLLSILAVGQQVQNEVAEEHRASTRALHKRLDEHSTHLAQTHRRLGEIQHHLTTPVHGATPKGDPRDHH